MKFVSRIAAFVLVLAMVLSFAGCSGGKATLNGTPIEEYTIVYDASQPDYNFRAAEYIQAQILERTGKELPICTASSGTYDHEILVGKTDRALSGNLVSNSRKMEFYFKADNSNIAMNGDYFIIAAAAYYFVETYIPGKSFQSTIPTDEIVVAQPITEKANNFIFLIGDGMGFNQTLMFDHLEPSDDVEFHDGEDIFYGYYFPYQGQSHTDSLSGTTDSAAGGTALSTGYKTINGYVGRDRDLNDIQSLTELTASLGKATAVMSTDLQTGATPASFSAHANDRDDSNDILDSQAELMENVGTVIRCNLNSTRGYQDEISDVLYEMDMSEKGFFLMYEEGHIDKHCHSNNAAKTFDCMVRFNQAIGLFMEYAFYNPDTFVIITADHETGGLQIDPDGGLRYTSTNHTSANVPVFAYGQGAENFDDFDDENIEIPKAIAALLGVSDFGF